MPVDRTDDSNHARGWVGNRWPMDATARSLGVASWWRCYAIDTARGIWPGAATADAGPIHHAQAAISFAASLMRDQLLASRTM